MLSVAGKSQGPRGDDLARLYMGELVEPVADIV
jgi:hypothetical protein